MRKTIELKKLLDAQRKKVDDLYKQEQFDDAANEAKQLNELKREYDIAAAVENAANVFQGEPVNGPIAGTKDAKKLHNRIFNKLVLGDKFGFAALTDEEKEYAKTLNATTGQLGATPAKGGYLIPEEQMNTILEPRRAFTQLKNYCNVQVVNSRIGSIPTATEETGQLDAFDELGEISNTDIDFGQIKWSTHDYGDIIPVANQLLQDIDVDLTGLIANRFARKAVNTENAKILALVQSIDATAITDYKGIKTALNKTLDPEISATATIFTNQTGYDYLDQLEDAQKRPLLTPDVTAPGQYRFRGRPIVVLKDTIFKVDATTIPFLVGSLSDFAIFFDRLGVELAVSTEALFSKYATAIRAVERFDVQKRDGDAMAYLTLKTTTA
ncbi:phage major capsid protein [Megasphaera sp.]|uniref:phage major capsid protein n=1 Tax=Megasphaera sp. TaxID=2023260 RepID=UPI003521DC84